VPIEDKNEFNIIKTRTRTLNAVQVLQVQLHLIRSNLILCLVKSGIFSWARSAVCSVDSICVHEPGCVLQPLAWSVHRWQANWGNVVRRQPPVGRQRVLSATLFAFRCAREAGSSR